MENKKENVKSNVYQKLQKIRVALQEAKLKKSGKNKHSGHSYFELKDFLPKLNELMLENGLATQICFGSKLVKLKVVDSENPESSAVFCSPMVYASLPKGKGEVSEIKNLGATHTYLRRYLLINAFEIIEVDAVEGASGGDNHEVTPASNNSYSKPKASNANETGYVCNKCGEPLVQRKRKSDGGIFYGCSGYPDCKNTVNPEKLIAAKSESSEPPPHDDEDIPF